MCTSPTTSLKEVRRKKKPHDCLEDYLGSRNGDFGGMSYLLYAKNDKEVSEDGAGSLGGN